METTQTPAPVKKEWTPDQIMEKNIRTMPDRQLSRRLKRLKRSPGSNMDSTWAIILSIVFDSKMEPYLR